MRSLLIAVSLALSGCVVTTPAPSTVSEINLTAADSLSRAADAYTGVATLVEAAVRHGQFNNDQLKMIRALNNQALKLLNGADTTLTVAQRVASLELIRKQLHSILGR